MTPCDHTFAFCDFELDGELRELRRRGRPAPLRRRPLELLLYLLHNRHRVVPKTELLDTLWPDVVVSEAALSSAMRDLRRALHDDGRTQSVIKTHHGFGYRFAAPVRTIEQAPLAAGWSDSAGDGGGWRESFARRLVAFVLAELGEVESTGPAPLPARSRTTGRGAVVELPVAARRDAFSADPG